MSVLGDFWRRTIFPSVETFDTGMRSLRTQIEQLEDALVDQYGSAKVDLTTHSVTQAELLETLALIQPMDVTGFVKGRFGSAGDGGYILLDDLAPIKTALSFGILDNDDWDLEMAQRGIDVKQYDFSIDSAPSKHERLTFFPLKIGPVLAEGIITIDAIVNALPQSDEADLLLKMDIEGSEWQVVLATPSSTLRRFRQITCEFHELAMLKDRGFHAMASQVFAKLNETHQCVHIHANNYLGFANLVNISFPQLVELTFVSRQSYTFEASSALFPTALDQPNCGDRPDLFLGTAQFKTAGR